MRDLLVLDDRILTIHSKVSFWVTTEIVSTTNSSQRLEMLRRFIDIASVWKTSITFYEKPQPYFSNAVLTETEQFQWGNANLCCSQYGSNPKTQINMEGTLRKIQEEAV